MTNLFKKEQKDFWFFSFVFLTITLAVFFVEPLKNFLNAKEIDLGIEIIFLYYALILATLGFLYGYGIKLFKNNPPKFKSLFLLFSLFNFLFFFTQPTVSSDFFSYISQSRVFSVYGENPFFSSFAEFPQDDFFSALKNSWSDEVTPYGPVFIYLMSVVTFLGKNSLLLTIFLTKSLFVLVNFGILFLLNKIFKDNFINFLYIFNPILLIEFGINMHNESILILFILIGLYFYFKKGLKNFLLASNFFLLAVFVKIYMIIFLPILGSFIFFHQKNARKKIILLFLVGGSFFVLAVITYLPFFEGKETFRGIIAQSEKWNLFSCSPLIFIGVMISYLRNSNPLENIHEITNNCRIFFVGTSLIFYVYVYAKLRKGKNLLKDDSLILCLTLILSWFYFTSFSWFMPWYLTPLIFFLIVNFKLTKERIYLTLLRVVTVLEIFLYLFVR